ncbi:MAG TPA: hypothetical protein VF712_01925 [Thermoleophilaceae bacterium]
MARRSLKPQLNQIRSWVQQGRTDAWIAHQLDVSVGDLVAFKREHELAPPEADPEGDGSAGPAADAEQDLREQDEALIAAALDAEPEEPEEGDGDGDAGEAGGDDDRPRRRRGRRGGRARRGRKRALEGTFDHGEEGYGLWLDPAVQDDPVYAEHWAGHRPVTVTVERDQIVIRRAGEGAGDGEPGEGAGDGRPAGRDGEPGGESAEPGAGQPGGESAEPGAGEPGAGEQGGESAQPGAGEPGAGEQGGGEPGGGEPGGGEPGAGEPPGGEPDESGESTGPDPDAFDA